MKGEVEFDADGYAYVRVRVNGVDQIWCLTDHDLDRVWERGLRRVPPKRLLHPPPTWWQKLLVRFYNFTREKP